MNDNLTQKVQEALKAAQQEAARRNHQAIDSPHVLAALLAQEDGLAPRVVEKAGASAADLRAKAEELLARIPSVSGPGRPSPAPARRRSRARSTSRRNSPASSPPRRRPRSGWATNT